MKRSPAINWDADLPFFLFAVNKPMVSDRRANPTKLLTSARLTFAYFFLLKLQKMLPHFSERYCTRFFISSKSFILLVPTCCRNWLRMWRSNLCRPDFFYSGHKCDVCSSGGPPAMASWPSGIVSTCHRGDWSYGSWDRIPTGYRVVGSF
jgi:hypothetical protein